MIRFLQNKLLQLFFRPQDQQNQLEVAEELSARVEKKNYPAPKRKKKKKRR